MTFSRRAALDRVQHDLVDEAHHRRVFHVVPGDIVARQVVVAAADLQALQVEVVFGVGLWHVLLQMGEQAQQIARGNGHRFSTGLKGWRNAAAHDGEQRLKRNEGVLAVFIDR